MTIVSGLKRNPQVLSIIVLFLALISIFQFFGIVFGIYEALTQDDPQKLFFILVDILQSIGIIPSIQAIFWAVLTTVLMFFGIKLRKRN